MVVLEGGGHNKGFWDLKKIYIYIKENNLNWIENPFKLNCMKKIQLCLF